MNVQDIITWNQGGITALVVIIHRFGDVQINSWYNGQKKKYKLEPPIVNKMFKEARAAPPVQNQAPEGCVSEDGKNMNRFRYIDKNYIQAPYSHKVIKRIIERTNPPPQKEVAQPRSIASAFTGPDSWSTDAIWGHDNTFQSTNPNSDDFF